MPSEVVTQTRTSEPARGTAKKGNRSRGGNTNNRGSNRAAAPATTGGAAKGNGTQNKAAAAVGASADAPAAVAGKLAEVALSDAGEEVCWICAEPVKYYSVSECNHRTCHVCALRLRALYKKTLCTFCKVHPPSHPSLSEWHRR